VLFIYNWPARASTEIVHASMKIIFSVNNYSLYHKAGHIESIPLHADKLLALLSFLFILPSPSLSLPVHVRFAITDASLNE